MGKLNEAECKEREKQVNEQVSRIGKFIDEADVLMNNLINRLEVVLRQEPEGPTSENAKDSIELVALAYDLNCKADRIANQNRRIENLLGRLEI
jgi:hypothetical protein